MAKTGTTASSYEPHPEDNRQGQPQRRRSIRYEEPYSSPSYTANQNEFHHQAPLLSQLGTNQNGIELFNTIPGPEDYETNPDDQAPPSGLQVYRRRYSQAPAASETDTVVFRPFGAVDVAAVVFNKMVGAGIYTVPGQVLQALGDKRFAVLVWGCGGIYTLFCLSVYMELGAEFPHNGGELIYLDRTLRPGLLWTLMFATFFITIANTTGNAIVFAKFVMIAALPVDASAEALDPKIVKLIAVDIVSVVCLLHYLAPRLGRAINRLLAVYKLCLMIIVSSACFWEATHGHYAGLGKDAGQPSKDVFSKISAIVLVLYSYTGWENANYIAGEISKPNTNIGDPKSLPRGAYSAVLVATAGYILVTLGYYLAFDYSTIISELDLGMAKNLGQLAFKPYGISLEVLFAFSAVGNLVAVVFTSAKVKQTLARQRVLPMWEYFQKDLDSPKGGLALHWFFTVVMVLATPVNTDGYNFVVGLYTYGQIVVVTFSTLGLLTFLLKKSPWRTQTTVMNKRPVGLSIIALVLSANLFLIISGAFRNKGEPISKTSIPGWLWTVFVAGLWGLGALYWGVIYVLQPDILGDRLGAQIRIFRTVDPDRPGIARESPVKIYEIGESLAPGSNEAAIEMLTAISEAREDGTRRRLDLRLDKFPRHVHDFLSNCALWLIEYVF